MDVRLPIQMKKIVTPATLIQPMTQQAHRYSLPSMRDQEIRRLLLPEGAVEGVNVGLEYQVRVSSARSGVER